MTPHFSYAFTHMEKEKTELSQAMIYEVSKIIVQVPKLQLLEPFSLLSNSPKLCQTMLILFLSSETDRHPLVCISTTILAQGRAG